MKKILFSLIAFMAAIIPVAAQDAIFYNPDNKAYLGARVGLDITSASQGYGVYNNGFGAHIGAIYNIPIWKNLYFEPGLSVFYDTFGEDITEIAELGPDQIFTASIRNMGFRVPLAFGYRFDLTDEISVAPFTGPQFNYGFLAREHYKGHSWSMFGDMGFKHFDAQWIFGLSISYQKYYIALYGAAGINDIFDKTYPAADLTPESRIHYRRNTFSITLGYNF